MSTKKIDPARVAMLAGKVKAVVDETVAKNIGRLDVIWASLLSLICGRPAFFLGSFGINKTGTVQNLVQRIVGASFYDALMPTITSAEQLIVESTSIEETPVTGGGKSIRTHDTLGRAAAAHVVFADEIWKGDPRVLQTVLDLSKGDGVRLEGVMQQTPLMAFLAASNELPDQDGNLGAMWSRMTIRVLVKALDRTGKTALVKARLHRSASSTTPAQLTLAEIEELRGYRAQVQVPQAIVDIVLEIYEKLRQDDAFGWLWDDDRRFGRVFDVLQAQALLNGRTQVINADLTVLRWLLWDAPEQIAKVETVIAPYIRTPAGDARELIDALLATGGNVYVGFTGSDSRKATAALSQCKDLKDTDLPRLKTQAGGTSEEAQIQKWINALTTFIGKLAQKIAGIDVGTWDEVIKDLN